MGSLLVKRGCDLLAIKEIMRHSDVHTTMRYLHISDATKRENVVLNKALTLTGSGSGDDPQHNTIIVAAQKDQPVIAITAGNVVVKDLHVTGANEGNPNSHMWGSGFRLSHKGTLRYK
jgi:nitrous oxidase accessory protein NosD